MERRLEWLVTAQAERTPDARAIVFGEEDVTYARLQEQSNRLARMLISAGCKEGDRVCLFVAKNIQAIIGLLAVIKAGCAYVPVDIDSPPARVRRIINAAEPATVLADTNGMKLLDSAAEQNFKSTQVISTESEPYAGKYFQTYSDFSHLNDFRADPIENSFSTAGMAQLLFTSGSTGEPKGVMITHRNITGFIDWATRYFDVSAGDQVSGHPPLHFDLSTFDIFGALTRGATLHMVPPQLNLMAPRLAEWMRAAELTQWFSVPSILSYMANFDVVKHGDFPAMKRLLWCGEVLPTPTLAYWMERLPHVKFTNLYGPTEATIASSFYTVARCPTDEKESVPIGQACDGEELLVLDGDLEPVPTNTIGELYIRGIGLSPGYWRDSEKTRAVFQTHAQAGDESTVIYRTGDLGRRDEDGFYHFVGRTDSQIKSRGHRIELGEIEAALNTLSQLSECAVVGVETDGFEGALICCAYVAESEQNSVPAKLRKELSGLVPRYMLPSRWQKFDLLPKNANGKIDKSKIRDIFKNECLDKSKTTLSIRKSMGS